MRGLLVVLLIWVVIFWGMGFRIHYVQGLYVPVCSNNQSMVVDAVCVDYLFTGMGRCDYFRVIKECPND